MKFLKRIFVLLASVLALLVTGCAGLPSGMEAPTVTIADFGAGGGGFFEQQFNLKLRVQNPNNSELKIDGVSFALEVNDAPFANGVGNQPVTVARFGTAFLPVEAYSSLGGMIRQIGGFLQGDKRALRYRLRGSLSVAGGTRIPFERSGEFDLGALAPK
jgi:LEA14-like dessication related protein